MKKVFISILLFLPLFMSAQNVLTPQQQLEQAQKQLEEAKKAVEAAKAAKAAAEKAAAEQKAAAEAAAKAAQEAAAKAAKEKAAKEAAEKQAKIAQEKARLEAEKKKIDDEVAKLKAETERLQKEAEQLKTGAEQIKTGAEQIKTGAEQLKDGELKPSIANEPVTLPAKDKRPVVVDVPASENTGSNGNATSNGNAQSGWVVPTQEKKVETKPAITNATGVVLKKDPKYLEGAITTDKDGKVEFTLDTNANGKSAQQIYDLVYGYMQSLVGGKNDIRSRVALVNPQEHIIANTMDEWFVFSASFISLDRTEARYQLVAKITDNHLNLTFSRLFFTYEEGRSTGFKDAAENIITDKYALNKKKTDFAKIYGKFRKATIDRKDQIFNDIATLIKQK